MNEAHMHLLSNHLPVVGFLFATGLAVLALLRGSEELRRVALGTVIVAGLLGLPAYFTGEPAEEVVEHLPGVTESTIEAHEEAAEGAVVAAVVAAALAAVALGIGIRRTVTPTWAVFVVTVGGLVAAGWLGYTANLGGRIRHAEIDAPARGSAPEGPDHGESP